jgi:hypothetical protein
MFKYWLVQGEEEKLRFSYDSWITGGVADIDRSESKMRTASKRKLNGGDKMSKKKVTARRAKLVTGQVVWRDALGRFVSAPRTTKKRSR